MINLTIFATTTCKNDFFGFPVWWKYIKPQPKPPNCEIKISNFPNDLWAIAFAVIDMLLYLAGIVAVVAIIIAGIMYITSMGNIEKTTAARKRIINSLIGLAIVLIAAPIVAFIGNRLGG